ncbi:hypothetical protein [Gordonia sp. NPDC003422]
MTDDLLTPWVAVDGDGGQLVIEQAPDSDADDPGPAGRRRWRVALHLGDEMLDYAVDVDDRQLRALRDGIDGLLS